MKIDFNLKRIANLKQKVRIKPDLSGKIRPFRGPYPIENARGQEDHCSMEILILSTLIALGMLVNDTRHRQ